MNVRWLGRVEYMAAWRLQEELADAVIAGTLEDTLILLEHPPTLTLGRGADHANLLATSDRLSQLAIAVHEIDRGGDITYHGPGQLVGYPIFDLSRHRKDLHWFLREMEAALIDVLEGFGLAPHRFPPHTGVWIDNRKIAAIGVKVRRWVTTHGFALNVNPDLSHFDLIVPCGIREFGVTSLRQEGHIHLNIKDLLVPVPVAFQARFMKEGNSRVESASPLLPESRAIWEAGEPIQ